MIFITSLAGALTGSAGVLVLYVLDVHGRAASLGDAALVLCLGLAGWCWYRVGLTRGTGMPYGAYEITVLADKVLLLRGRALAVLDLRRGRLIPGEKERLRINGPGKPPRS